MQRGWSSFADTRQKPNATSSIRMKGFFEIFAEVCRRRCPTGRRPQAPQRPKDFGRRIVVTNPPAQLGWVSAVTGACGAERNQPATGGGDLHLNEARVGFEHGRRGMRKGGEVEFAGASGEPVSRTLASRRRTPCLEKLCHEQGQLGFWFPRLG